MNGLKPPAIAWKTFARRLGLAVALLTGALCALNAQELIPLADTVALAKLEAREFTFSLTEAPEENWKIRGHQVRLALDARIAWGGLGGYTSGMGVSVNGQGLAGRHLLNKPLSATLRNGSIFQWGKRDGSHYLLFYSASFSDDIRAFIRDAYVYGFPDADQDPFRFVWDITPYVQPGSNLLTVRSSETPPRGIVLENVAVELGPPLPSRNQDLLVSPAPTGPLEVFTPGPPTPLPAVYVSPDGGIRVGEEPGAFVVRSRTSLPAGEWTGPRAAPEAWRPLRSGRSLTASWTGHAYAVSRRVTVHTDRVAVADTVTHTEGGLAGVMVENRLVLPERPSEVRLAGLPRPLKRSGGGAHPMALAKVGDTMVGVVAEDDILRLHAEFFEDDDAVGFADRCLGIPPGGAHTLEWSLYAIPGGDYWDLINAVRRAWGANFTLEGPVDFPCGRRFNYINARRQTADDVREWLAENHNALPWVMTHVAVNPNIAMATATPDNPAFKHGTAILDAPAWIDMTRKLVTLLKEVDPKVKVFAYLHKNLCTEVGSAEKYPDSAALDARPGVFVPTLENSYGKALAKVYRFLVEDIGANLYLDEISHAYRVVGDGETVWDGCTVAIDPGSHAVTGRRSSGFLLVQPWLADLMDYLESQGRSAFANMAPITRTAAGWRLQHFTEDTGPSGVISMHLSTPLAWSYRRGAAGFRHLMESLDYGGIAFSRGGDWSDHLFPITPIELRAGIVIAEERILTNRSGRFGWGDSSRAEVRVYDGQGRPVEQPDVRETEAGGEVLTEIRMPGDHLAILVRRPPAGDATR